MTLSLIAMTHDRVLHAADTRISYEEAATHQDVARKWASYISTDARMTLSHSGLAEFQRADSKVETFEQWLSRMAPSLDHTTVYSFATSLMHALNDTVSGTTQIANDTRLCVMLAGFQRDYAVPAVIWISNFDAPWRGLRVGDNGLGLPAEVSPFATTGEFSVRGILSAGRSCVLIHGAHNLLDSHAISMLHRLGGPPADTDASAACALLANVIRHVGDANPNGSVSGDCWTQTIERSNPNALYTSNFRDPSLQTPSPLIIGPNAVMQLTVSQPLSDYEAALDRLTRDLTGCDLLSHGALTAYLDWSPVLRRFADVMAQRGLTVLPAHAEYLPDLKPLIDLSGFKWAATMERHLERTNGWGAQLAAMYADKIVAANCGATVSTWRRTALALALVALNPDKYPIERPPTGLPDYLSRLPWPISEELMGIVRDFHRNRGG